MSRLFSLALLLASASALANVSLPGFFGSHMVLQRDTPMPFWGWAAAGESVSVSFAGKTAETKADAAGKWRVELPAQPAGGPHTLSVRGKNELTYSDILVGEVWLCSGQSNMEWTVRSSANAATEIAAATYPRIRHIKVPKRPSAVPLDDIKGSWKVCSPGTAANFTACGYFMARNLLAELDVPIGLINSSWGGTRVEPWTAPEGFAAVPALASIKAQVDARTAASPTYRKALTQHISATEKWVASAKTSLTDLTPVPPPPALPASLKPPTNYQDPVMLYNGMIHALVGLPFRGAIWYQGESNHGEGMLYTEKKKALIGGWRELWGMGDFPFYFVQIAPFQYGAENPSVLADFWEAQEAVLQIPNTGMVVTSDISTLQNIHPPNKQDVGKRLALLALNRTYEVQCVDKGPTFSILEPSGKTLISTFANSAGGLESRDGKPLNWFEVAGAGTGYHKAEVTIKGDTLVLSSQAVPNPTAMRFAWHKLAEPNLTNGAGLPCGAFRAGEIPKPDFLPEIDDAKGYTLACDLDLSKLSASPSYDIDVRNTLKGKVARVAYLMELQSADFGLQYVYVAMDAFTDELAKIAIPTHSSAAKFARKVSNLTVRSNVKGIVTGDNLAGGNIEFWPHNYAAGGGLQLPGGSQEQYDFDDVPGEPADGYGCMQVHNHAAKQTLFAINQWKSGSGANIGIGNSKGPQPDWTFTPNASSYDSKRLRVFVKMK
ncbi:MAG: sialate O-acetylesterase [Rhodothermales bacterium]|jgi:sialate O-acetylesterase